MCDCAVTYNGMIFCEEHWALFEKCYEDSDSEIQALTLFVLRLQEG